MTVGRWRKEQGSHGPEVLVNCLGSDVEVRNGFSLLHVTIDLITGKRTTDDKQFKIIKNANVTRKKKTY